MDALGGFLETPAWHVSRALLFLSERNEVRAILLGQSTSRSHIRLSR